MFRSCWQLFAAAIIAGLPFGVATNMREALSGMFQSPSRPAAELGDLVRNASSHKGPWPKLSVWHGSADRTVNPANADEIVKQWLDVHGLPSAPMSEADVDGYPRQVWWNADGELLRSPSPWLTARRAGSVTMTTLRRAGRVPDRTASRRPITSRISRPHRIHSASREASRSVQARSRETPGNRKAPEGNSGRAARRI
jgi:hypothetical protein